MSRISYLLIGVLFGIVLFKSEAASWFRIYEMFRFESFHMYGIIGSAVICGVLITQFFKKTGWKDISGKPILFVPKEKGFVRYLVGGILFGLGWGLAGACPGPMYVLLGSGFWSILIVIVFALLGTFLYGLFRKHLPH